MTNYQSFLNLLQLSSPNLPLGAYSYSEGLEHLVIREIKDSQQLYLWLEQELTYGTIRLEGAIMLKGYQYYHDLSQLNYWNSWLTASKETRELRQQSRQMGKSLKQICNQLADYPIFEQMEQNFTYSCNYPLVFGVACAYWQINREMALLAYLHNWASNLISSGIKLIPLGQTAGQKILHQINLVIEEQAPNILNLEDDQLYSCGVGLSLASMNHEDQYTRLFRS